MSWILNDYRSLFPELLVVVLRRGSRTSGKTNKPRITDAGLKHLQKLPQLMRLELEGHPITDAGLIYLHKLKRLEYVNLWKTKVLPEGIAELRKVFPKLDVNR